MVYQYFGLRILPEKYLGFMYSEQGIVILLREVGDGVENIEIT